MEEENISPHSEPGLPPAGGTNEPAPSANRWKLQCPRCDSLRVRKPTRPFQINILACMISTALTMVLCAAVFGLLLALIALPITTCVAIVGRRRCLHCGHRFELGWANTGAAARPGFPWLFHVLNFALLFILCIVGPYAMRFGAGAGGLPDMMMEAGLFLMFGLLLWGSLVCHLVLYYVLGRKVKSKLVWALLFILPGAVGGAKVFYESSPKVRIQDLLTFAEMAPLPEAATGIRYYTWSTPFSGEDFLRFTAEPNDIERFLAESLALRDQQPENFSAQRMKLERPKDYLTNPDYKEDGNIYYKPPGTMPHWYKRQIRGPARKYRIQPPRYQYPGEVLIDDETNTVYIYLCFS